MTITALFFACAVASRINLVSSIKCYNCAVIPTIEHDQVVTPSCSKFDSSPNYIIDCPYSTMCSRIISTMYLQKGYEQKTVTLGCAPQKRLLHVLQKGMWKEEHSVQEIYSEDCKTMNNANLVGATKTYCYCRGTLCNSGQQIYSYINAMNFLLPFLITKISF